MAGSDSSEEDEPIAVPQSAPAPPKAWMDEDADEEEEDADLSQLQRQRSPKFKRCMAAVDKDPWNADAWIALLNEVQQLPVGEGREHYEKFLSQFPTSGRWWKLYAEHELREKQYDRVQEVIKKSLMQLRCPNVDLWRFYLDFTKVVKLDVAVDSKDPAAIATARQLMVDAFELAVERVGGSIHAAPIWQMYLTFVQEEQDPQAFLNVRKLYHRMVMVPLNGMETIWRDYEKFERAIPNNDALAQNFFKVFRPKFDAARAVLRDRKKLYDQVNTNALAVPATSSRADAADMANWQKILALEMGNPERLDALRLKSRMRYTLELFVSVKRHYPEAWYQYATYENQANDPDAAASVFERAVEALPDSSYLHFAYADHHELRGDIPAAKAIYEKLIKDHASALAYVTYQRFARRAYGAKGLSEARAIFKRARKDEREGACTYHVFAASALLEFYSDNSETGKDIALKIFELGLKKCIQEPAYVLCYLQFLGHLNDDNNMRSLFEKVLSVMPAEVSRPIWDRYVEFEHTMVASGGDLATVAKVEARRAMAFPDEPFVEMKGLLSIAHRYSFLDLRPPTSCDQSFLDMYRASSRGGSLANRDAGGEDGEGIGAIGLGGGFGLDMEMQIPGPPLPDFLKEFAGMLPLNLPWNGPIADVEHIFRAMLLVDFPPRSRIEQMAQQQQQQMQQQLALQHHQQLQQQAAEAEKNSGLGDDDGSSGVVSKRPAHDIFRSRQKQKLSKLG
ncbi:Cleavage stimulation factor subunit 77 [Phytophthora ramorum]|uniref:Suppressor of forked domain-containing protein n=1 Tax=Phytophthora ramorum TaxID=164328 RepID=H3GFY5_PHYRM|nr:Cleavage stimulation factor subunit 77 [Phytophthora ramorum]